VTGDDIAKSGGATAAQAPAVTPATSSSTDPQELMRANQCLACHKVGAEGGAIGPDLSKIGALRDQAYIRRAILNPDAEIPAGFEAMKGVMPKTFGQAFTAGQLEAIVDYLAALK
jgi:mono/diheme cytochrome c family protein